MGISLRTYQRIEYGQQKPNVYVVVLLQRLFQKDMRYAAWEQAPEVYKGMYINLSRWCNQPAQYSKKSLREFCTGQGEYSSCFRYLTAFEALHPEMAHYLDMKYEEVQYGKIYG